MNTVILDKSLEQLASKIFPFCNRLETVTYMAPAGSGKRTLMKIALSNNKLMGRYIKNPDSYIFIFVDTEDLVGTLQTDYLRLMILQLQKKLGIKGASSHIEDYYILETLRTLLKKAIEKYKVVWVINNIEYLLSRYPSLFDNFLSIKHEFNERCSFVYLSTVNIASGSILKTIRDGKFELTKNMLFHPIMDNNEAIKYATEYSKTCKGNLTREEIKELINIVGGHVLTIRTAIDRLTVMSKNSTKPNIHKLFSDYHLSVVCADIWSFLNDKEKEYLISISTKNKDFKLQEDTYSRYLIETCVIKKEWSGWSIFSRLFHQFVQSQPYVSDIIYDDESKQLMWRVKSLEDIFTKNEYAVLELLVKQDEHIVSRDEIAITLWGEEHLEKYSDWAIDKTISLIRKKLIAVGLSEGNIVTVKKRGFKWTKV